MKKRWVKPELQVLIRGRIEESVLCHCKTQAGGQTWPYGSGGCDHDPHNCRTNHPS